MQCTYTSYNKVCVQPNQTKLQELKLKYIRDRHSNGRINQIIYFQICPFRQRKTPFCFMDFKNILNACTV